MKKVRIIVRLDIKGGNVIKGIQFECLRVMGKPGTMAAQYYLQGADELVYLDTVANLYQRQKLIDIVRHASESIHIPFTIGGGVRSVDDVRELLKAGADKVAINTEVTKNPRFIKEAAEMFGSQCIVASIEAKRKAGGKYEAYVDNGRQPTGLDAVEWALEAERLGAGEILLTSVDMDGTERGLDFDLIKAVSEALSISLVVSGGVGGIEDFEECITKYNVDGVAAASIFHYNKYNLADVKDRLVDRGLAVRRTSSKVNVSTDAQQEYDIENYNKFTLNQLEDEEMRVENVYYGIKEEKDVDDFDIGVINYGINNLKSVLTAFERLGKRVHCVDTPEDILASKCLVMPGVGAFKEGMAGLAAKRLIEPIKEKVASGTPMLGICLGMQMFFSESGEFGLHKGLGLIPGKVVSFMAGGEAYGRKCKIPHIGWNELTVPSFGKASHWEETVLKDIEERSNVYFVHSFYAVPDNPENVIATVEYGGQEVCVVAQHGNVTAMQFHPEKSGEVGLKMLKGFCDRNGM
ncbi:MAG: imidazole glycerol phosphate synthase subunit HisH [Candidatus Omnitrophica bacterium]|nr:imidazole glycerol phosphate synthase subunit HisH [Candidatus Omnitrophota bacterium]MBU1128593.1 imidazole glycerol phosphate synthase subunit HisH [Candidatus Omnitrophota bacterium]MBU1784720.1 imidazole glycerol phosphate synthase subunit HisH [Candidatus Omnitrophota bacterium]MBU1851557.1 imidazole glycerol phosphate synthase subunit HisH [Candidatus Omnitrophota bacterium]